MQLLLLSNSTQHGEGYLDHAIAEVRALFAGRRRLVFVPFALKDHAGYTAKAASRLAADGFEVVGLTADAAGHAQLAAAEGVFVGGGNSFRLLDVLQRSGLLEALASSGEITRAAQPKGAWIWRSRGLGLPSGAAQALLDELREERA